MKNLATYDKFLAFRATIIRAISRAWIDAKYKEELIKDPRAALYDAFDYRCPFEVDLKVHDKNASWTPALNGGWTVHQNNRLEMVLPPAPKMKEGCSERERVLIEACALAEYNANHLTFLTK
jgi:ribosomally synthesized peptide (two-chain TOMM family)